MLKKGGRRMKLYIILNSKKPRENDPNGSLRNKYHIFIMATVKSHIATNERNSSLLETGRGSVWGNGNQKRVNKAFAYKSGSFEVRVGR